MQELYSNTGLVAVATAITAAVYWSCVPGRRAQGRTSASENHAWAEKDITISKLLIHPIKSCRGLSVSQANYTPAGLEHDRTWCITDATTHAVLTAREISKMVLVTPEIIVDESVPYGGLLVISFPSDSNIPSLSTPLRPTEEILRTWAKLENVPIWDHVADGYICLSLEPTSPTPSAILSQYLGRPVDLVYKGPRPRICSPTVDHPNLDATVSYQDGYPLLILSEESVGAVTNVVRGQVGKQGVEENWRVDHVAVERFRPNIVIQGAGAFAEDQWERIVIGNDPEAFFTLISKCVRCLLPNVSPETGIRDKAVPYKVMMKFRTKLHPQEKMKPCMGCNALSSKSGVLHVGDRVQVEEWILPVVSAEK